MMFFGPDHIVATMVAVSFAAGLNVSATMAMLGLLGRFRRRTDSRRAELRLGKPFTSDSRRARHESQSQDVRSSSETRSVIERHPGIQAVVRATTIMVPAATI